MKISSLLVRLFIQEWNSRHPKKKIENAYHIGQGWCYQFAILPQRVYPQFKLFQTIDGYGHCFVRYENKFYDSVELGGTGSLELIMNDNIEGMEFREVTEETCARVWNRLGGSGKVDFEVINATIQKWENYEKSNQKIAA